MALGGPKGIPPGFEHLASQETAANQAQQPDADFLQRIQDDPVLRGSLAIRLGQEEFYGALKKGRTFDDAQDLGSRWAISWSGILSAITEDDYTLPEDLKLDYLNAKLTAVEEHKRIKDEPGPVRKWMAAQFLGGLSIPKLYAPHKLLAHRSKSAKRIRGNA